MLQESNNLEGNDMEPEEIKKKVSNSKDEIEKLRAIIAIEAAEEDMDKEVENDLEVTLIEVEKEVIEVEQVLEEKKGKKEAGAEKKKRGDD